MQGTRQIAGEHIFGTALGEGPDVIESGWRSSRFPPIHFKLFIFD